MTGPPVLAVVVCRDGRLPSGAAEAARTAGGHVVVVGEGAAVALAALTDVVRGRWCDTGPGLRPAALARALADIVDDYALVVLPDSPDGRDLAPRLAAATGRPLLARAVDVEVTDAAGAAVRALLTRVDDKVLVPVDVPGPAIATLATGGHGAGPVDGGSPSDVALEDDAPEEVHLDLTLVATAADPELVDLLEPDPRTMDLADATRVLSGGAGLVAGQDDTRATATFGLLVGVAAALGGSAGATRVASDAGWTGYERQIGTTGVVIDPDLYVAFGVSGATQHTGGLGAPRHVVSVNTDPSCPMTAMADLGLVTDARALLVELARRLDVDGEAGRHAEVSRA